MTLRSLTMARFVSILGLFVGCAILAIAIAGTPRSDNVEAHENGTSASTDNCRVEEVMLDEGYGVSRKEQRRICAATE
jgi:hypothetical protein